MNQTLTNLRRVDRYDPSPIDVRQRAYLRRLLRATFPDRRPVQHDIACGTGHGVRLLHGLVREAHGYDTGAAHLAAARAAGLRAYWHEVPADGPVPRPAVADGPAVVTVLGPLLRAPREVRHRAIEFAGNVLTSPTSGLLILENQDGARQSEVVALLRRHSFTIVERRAFSMFPATPYRSRPLATLVSHLDDLLCRFGFLSRFGANVLYVAQRRPFTPHSRTEPER